MNYRNELLTKLNLFQPGAFGQSSLKEEILFLAYKELLEFCSFPVYKQDTYFQDTLVNELLTRNVIQEMKLILFCKRDISAYDKFLLKKQEEMKALYEQYFNHYTFHNSDGSIYNYILGMTWNEEDGLWEKTENGWCSFSAFMPYKNAKAIQKNAASAA